MRTTEFLSKLEHDRIIQAILEAEAKSSGEIRVYVQRGKLAGEALSEARKRFRALEMEKTRERNGVLIFVAPRARKFAIVGDKGIHEKCGNELWQRVVDKMREHFQNAHFTDALVEAIHEIGQVLAVQFPLRGACNPNELPDQVSGD